MRRDIAVSVLSVALLASPAPLLKNPLPPTDVYPADVRDVPLDSLVRRGGSGDDIVIGIDFRGLRDGTDVLWRFVFVGPQARLPGNDARGTAASASELRRTIDRLVQLPEVAHGRGNPKEAGFTIVVWRSRAAPWVRFCIALGESSSRRFYRSLLAAFSRNAEAEGVLRRWEHGEGKYLMAPDSSRAWR